MKAQIVISTTVQEETIAHIRSCGVHRAEGYVVWSGIQNDGLIHVKSVLIPNNGGLESFAHVQFSDESIEEVADRVISKGEKLVAQVHSHPFEAFHSEIDNEYPIVHRKGLLSIVIPYFGRYGFEEFQRYKVYEYLRNNKWKELGKRAMGRRFHIE